MKKIAIYKETEGDKIARIHFMPEDKTEEEIDKAVCEYNASGTDRVVSVLSIPDELINAFEYLINDRRLDINRHLEAIREMQDDIDSMSRDLDAVLSDLRSAIKSTNNFKKL